MKRLVGAVGVGVVVITLGLVLGLVLAPPAQVPSAQGVPTTAPCETFTYPTYSLSRWGEPIALYRMWIYTPEGKTLTVLNITPEQARPLLEPTRHAGTVLHLRPIDRAANEWQMCGIPD